MEQITTSKEYVAYDLASKVYENQNTDERNDIKKDFRKNYLDLYAECLYATRGYRDYDGKPKQKPINIKY
jgi:hypothetical protein